MYRINELLKFDRKLYHTNDLAILWGISNKNTLYTTIKRYVKKGILIPIYNGLYSTVSIDQLDKAALGQAIIHKSTYLTTESVLFDHGVISQKVYAYTFASSQSKKITVADSSYIFRKLSDVYLNNFTGIEDHGSYFVASLERAVADMIYFNPRYQFDNPDDIDWDKVGKIQKEVGYK